MKKRLMLLTLAVFGVLVFGFATTGFAQEKQRPQLRQDQDHNGNQMLRMDEAPRMELKDAMQLVDAVKAQAQNAPAVRNVAADTAQPESPTSTTTSTTAAPGKIQVRKPMAEDAFIVDWSNPNDYNIVKLYAVIRKPINEYASMVISMDSPVNGETQVIDSFSYQGNNPYGVYATVSNGQVVGLYGDRVARFRVSYDIDGVRGMITNEQRTWNKFASALFVADATSSPMNGSARVVLHGKFRPNAKTGILFGSYELSPASIEYVSNTEIAIDLWADPGAQQFIYEGAWTITVRQRGQSASATLPYLRLYQ